MTILIILGIILLVYIIGKYISARNKDANNQNTAQFGSSLSKGAKNIGCIVITVVGIVLILGFLLALFFLGGGYSS